MKSRFAVLAGLILGAVSCGKGAPNASIGSAGARDSSGSGANLGSGGASTATADLTPAPGCWSYARTTTPSQKGPEGVVFKDATLKSRVPTNHWWSALYWQLDPTVPRYKTGVYAHPIAASLLPGGLTFEYVDKPVLGQTDYGYRLIGLDPPGTPEQTQHDLAITIDGLTDSDPRLLAFTDWTATERWSDGAHTLDATLVEGGPYVFFEVSGGDAVIRVNPARPSSMFSMQGETLGLTVNGRSYGLFAPSGSTWTVAADGKSVRTSLAGKTYLSVSALPDNSASTLEFFRRHAYNVVSGAQASFEYDSGASSVKTHFEAQVANRESGGSLSAEPLLGLYPHQWKHSVASLSPYAFASARGPIKILEGSAFDITLPFHGVLPFLPLATDADSARLNGYLNEPESGPSVTTDTYYGAISAAKHSEQALIADQAGNSDLRDRLLNFARLGVEDWFEAHPGDTASFAYNADWSTLIGYPPDFGTDVFGNDHHYHWGYLLHAAAQVALYDPSFASDAGFGGMVKLLTRDVYSPLRDDPQFPFLRFLDVYGGHSWSSGSGNFGDGSNQESASEALNFDSSLILWGETTRNRTLRDLGVFLYATESEGLLEYWMNADNDVFPADFQHQHCVANVWGSGGNYTTWFGVNPAWIHGINYLPLTGGALWLGSRGDTLKANYQHMLTQRPVDGSTQPPNTWIDILLETQAFFDPDGAASSLAALPPDYPVETGETHAHTYAFITSLRALGQVDPSVTANVSTYGVFKKAGVETYVAFNAACQGSSSVAFSDGTHVDVPARTMTLFSAGKVSRTIPLGLTPDCTAPPPTCPGL